MLAILLILSLAFTGCTRKEPTTTPTTPTTTTAPTTTTMTTTQTPDEREMIGNMYTTGLPIVEKPVKLRVAVAMHPMNGNIPEMEVFKDLVTRTNVILDGDFVPFENWNEKKNLILASGDLPDLFLGYALNFTDIVKYGPMGYLVPLEDLIDQWAPNVQRILGMRPEYKIIAPDGHIYTLPSANELVFRENPDNQFINKTWLNRLGLDIPKTTEEFYEVLKAFKEQDPNENGKKDEIPFSFIYGGGAIGIHSLFGSFGVLDTDDRIMLENDKVDFYAIQPGYKQAIKYFAKLYSEGLIDPEVFTQDRPQYNAKGNAEEMLYGSYMGWNDEDHVKPEWARNDYVVLPPLKGPEGHQMWYRQDGAFINPGCFAITSKNKYPEVTMRWLDEIWNERTSLVIHRGPFGVTLQENSDGTIEFLPPPEGMSFFEHIFQITPSEAFPVVVLKETIDRIQLPAVQARKIDNHSKYKPYFPEQVYPKIMMTEEQSERLSILSTDINGYVNRMVANWITGERNVESDWNDFVNQLEKMGLKEYISIYQAAYDNYIKFRQ